MGQISLFTSSICSMGPEYLPIHAAEMYGKCTYIFHTWWTLCLKLLKIGGALSHVEKQKQPVAMTQQKHRCVVMFSMFKDIMMCLLISSMYFNHNSKYSAPPEN